jgi:hypothetical protein
LKSELLFELASYKQVMLVNDEDQRDVMRRLQDGQPMLDDLFKNCRNTLQVAMQASVVSGIDLALEGAPDGPECAVVFYKANCCLAAVERGIAALIVADVRPEDIVIFSLASWEIPASQA